MLDIPYREKYNGMRMSGQEKLATVSHMAGQIINGQDIEKETEDT